MCCGAAPNVNGVNTSTGSSQTAVFTVFLQIPAANCSRLYASMMLLLAEFNVSRTSREIGNFKMDVL